MKHCKDFEELIVESLYDEIDAARRALLDEHLAECDTCSHQLEEMRSTLGVMSQRTRRDPGTDYWEGYWDRLAVRMENEASGIADEVAGELGSVASDLEDTTRQSWWRSRVGSPAMSLAYRAAAVAAILVIGIFVGRTFFVPEEIAPPAVQDVADTGTQPEAGTGTDVATKPVTDDGSPGIDTSLPVVSPADVQLASSNERAMCYVEKSQVLLIGLLNNEPVADGYTSGADSKRARKLLDDVPAIKDDLSDPRQRRLRELVGELEKILVQIANLESSEDFEEVEFIKGRVNQHDVLLKINLEQLRQEADAADANCAAPGEGAKVDPQKGTI